MDFLRHFHSGWRYLVLLLLVFVVVNSLIKWLGKKEYSALDKWSHFLAARFMEVQVVTGIILWIMGKQWLGLSEMGVTSIRFYALEHPLAMILAVGLISAGAGKAKRLEEAIQKHKTAFTFTLIGLLITLASIPWAFRGL